MMTVLGRQHIAEDFETPFHAKIVQGLDELALEAVGVKNADPLEWSSTLKTAHERCSVRESKVG